ncbi:tetratricopeptide repeat protein [Breznakiella homolactica]|uniref:Tetratricopeptide repeat protein n=1 Tax=Breznakiella homolactica TaxID=2798577 RepID=A0A7T7XKN9_9SPIR|nr:tetratricopeptide repeat protein [Breznakiella homolactica]QQO08174.1 tetratricopeptide repeat protein [Breznakiella homolactica]
MNNKRSLPIFLCILVLLCLSPGIYAQNLSASLERGIELYGAGQWRDSVAELRRAQANAKNPAEKAEALYWISLAELAAGEYEAAIRDMDELLSAAPSGIRSAEVPYNKGRALYFLGQYNEAIVLLKNYHDAVSEASRKASSLYWIGECLYALGQLDQAHDIFVQIMDEYPQSPKYEAASYRIALINQKKIETELLAILKWSHEESLRTVEEYQRRERSYDQAIIAYQKRIADMLKDTRMADLENSNAEYRRRISELEARLAAAEAALSEANITIEGMKPAQSSAAPPRTSSEKMIKLLSLKSTALDLRNDLAARQSGSGTSGGMR